MAWAASAALLSTGSSHSRFDRGARCAPIGGLVAASAHAGRWQISLAQRDSGPLCTPIAYSMRSDRSNRVKLQRQTRAAQFLFNQIALGSRLPWRVSRRKDDQKVR